MNETVETTETTEITEALESRLPRYIGTLVHRRTGKVYFLPANDKVPAEMDLADYVSVPALLSFAALAGRAAQWVADQGYDNYEHREFVNAARELALCTAGFAHDDDELFEDPDGEFSSEVVVTLRGEEGLPCYAGINGCVMTTDFPYGILRLEHRSGFEGLSDGIDYNPVMIQVFEDGLARDYFLSLCRNGRTEPNSALYRVHLPVHLRLADGVVICSDTNEALRLNLLTDPEEDN